MKLSESDGRGVGVRWLTAPCSAAAVLGFLAVAAAAGRSLPAFGYLPRLPALEQRDVRGGQVPQLPNLRDEFLAAALGEKGLAIIVSPADARSSARSARSPVRSGPPTPEPVRAEPHIGEAGSWRLAFSMSADRRTVEPGGTIGYAVITRNTGSEPFRGEFMISAHVPFGTTDERPSPCGDAGIDPDPDHPCVNPAAPVPGPPTNDVHTVSHGQGYAGDAALAPGDAHVYTFEVRVAESARPGTRIANHAHLDVAGDGEPPQSSFEVVVTVT